MRIGLICLVLCAAVGLSGCEGKEGAPGVAGPQGRQGDQGGRGADGMNGQDGADGMDGMDGMDGADGMDGRDGADAVCANVEPLNVEGLLNFPEEILEDSDSGPIQVVSNATRDLRLSFAGMLPGLTFVDNGDGTFNIVTLPGSATDSPAVFGLIATDGCTADTVSFTVNGIGSATSKLTIVNLIDDGSVDLWATIDGELAGIPLEGATAGTTRGYFSVGQQNYVFSAYAANAMAASPEEYEEGAFIGMTETLSFGKRENHTIVLYRDAEGAFQYTQIVNDEAAPAEGNFAVNVGHFVAIAPQVDVWELTGGTTLVEDFDFATTTGRVELPAGDYNLGFDLDNDATPDLTFETITAAEGLITNLFAMVVDGNVQLGLVVLGANQPSFLTFGIPVAPLSQDGLGVAFIEDPNSEAEATPIAVLPFPQDADGNDAFIGYGDNVSVEEAMTSSAARTVMVPDATRLQVGIEYDFEPGYDALVVLDASYNIIDQFTGAGSEVIEVEGSMINFGSTSDNTISSESANIMGMTYQGYRIKSISYETAQ